jgi:glycosyltransferase involved in cell wall biosynthesis
MQQPKISIVMPSFNQGIFIDEAIRSVLSQDYPHKELIIIDGGSTDTSMASVARYECDLAYVVSEKDKGQSDALNKGFARATGDLLTWVNSDDVLLPGALTKVAAQAERTSDHRKIWIAGGCLWIDPIGRILRCTRARGWNKVVARSKTLGVFGPSSFFTRHMLERAGGIDVNFDFMMDTHLWLQFGEFGYSYTRVHGYLWGLRCHPEAKTSGYRFPQSQMASPKHPRRIAQELERLRLEQHHGIGPALQRLGPVISKCDALLSLSTYRGRLDTIRYHGMAWSTCTLP